MGKKRISVVGAEEEKKKKGADQEKRKVVKTGKEHGRITDMGQVALEEAQRIEAQEKKAEKEAEKLASETSVKEIKVKKIARKRSRRYLTARSQINRQKTYPLSEAIELVQKTSLSRFDGSVALHLVVKETGLAGEVSFPHPTGKQQRIAIADEKLIEKIKKGKLDFDILIATPAMMPKLASLAKTLGPKGLMPNPKKGTISENPEELVKKMSSKTQYKTEKNAPLIHLVIGKTKDPGKNLAENIQAIVNVLGTTNIKKAVLASTMGPGIKVDLASI